MHGVKLTQEVKLEDRIKVANIANSWIGKWLLVPWFKIGKVKEAL